MGILSMLLVIMLMQLSAVQMSLTLADQMLPLVLINFACEAGLWLTLSFKGTRSYVAIDYGLRNLCSY